MSQQSMIDVKNVTAAYGALTALNGVSLNVQKGEIFGLLGPNGAGKTTLLASVEGLHKPKQGEVHVGGISVQANPAATKRQLGIQLQKTALLDDLTVAELVEVYAALYEVYLTSKEIDALLARFDLVEKRNTLARRLSGGQQQRLALAVAIANDPQIVLLDEPTSALDPHARRAVWDIVRQLHDEGRTIVLTTHAMEEAEALCGRIAIIDRGQIVACDTPSALIANLKLNSMLKATVELPLDQVRALPEVSAARYTGQHLEVETARPEVTMTALHELALRSGRSIRDVMVRQPNLEDVFLKLTGRVLAESN
ncbi:MAG: ABC transporter ATP-binding protein [Anaerolineae bacterium]|nr:ABC transporter ATP-binding protein [Anaerolineae bacterium]MBL8105897.1 ABC transporter ATP-binding protein [Anaerolineales bacterium]MCC7188548.1 ABC transporter ATP-binding protein [Anaerolineales bacterium]